jgi:hypothetical protein
MIQLYACTQLLHHISENNFTDFESFKKSLPAQASRSEWINIGGQLISDDEVSGLKNKIKTSEIKSWDEVHYFYQEQGNQYENNKLQHAYNSLLELLQIEPAQFTSALFTLLVQEMVVTKEWMTKSIYTTREKDYTNPYRKMVYENNQEMLKVLGKIEDNGFINEQIASFDSLKSQIADLLKKWGLS